MPPVVTSLETLRAALPAGWSGRVEYPGSTYPSYVAETAVAGGVVTLRAPSVPLLVELCGDVATSIIVAGGRVGPSAEVPVTCSIGGGAC